MKKDRIKDSLRDKIENGDYPVGSLLPSERQLAAEFAISRLTLRRAIEPLVHEGLLENQVGRGTLVVDKSSAAEASRLRWKIMALVLPDISNRFYAEVAESVEYAALQQGYQILLCNSRHQANLEDFHLSQIAERGVDGVVFAHDPHLEMPQALQLLEAVGIPTVILFASTKQNACDTITLDDRAGVEQALLYLVSLGHRNIAFCRPLLPNQKHFRESHYEEFLSQNKIPYFSRNILNILGREEQDVRRDLDQMLSAPRASRPTAFLCGNDHVALMLMKQIGIMGLKIPADLSIVGFDNLRFVEHLAVPLTTVDQPKQFMGRRATEMLFERIHAKTPIAPRNEVFRPHLVIRESCAIASGDLQPAREELKAMRIESPRK